MYLYCLILARSFYFKEPRFNFSGHKRIVVLKQLTVIGTRPLPTFFLGLVMTPMHFLSALPINELF